MSHEGKMRRGKKWYSQRNKEGVLPDGIAKDPGKMCDVNYYLEHKEQEAPKVEPISTKKKGGK